MKRPANPKPAYFAQALETEGLKSLFDQRPWYQRNDCLSWIDRAKVDDTKMKRLQQMLDELWVSDTYMKMPWRPKR